MTDTRKNQILSIGLILFIYALSFFFYDNDYDFRDRLLMSIPVFTLLVVLYACVYGFKYLITKIVFVLLLIASVIVLSIIWWIYEYAKGMRSH
ncbi:hypothetical protein QWY99_18360 [Flavobacterium branchiarum]|uniref:Uncharacterized protein n=1 Tax=Flavobacterium branchiarum TaxID=1114870 RepID=A0ABV5FSJ4_9FLAO|nr:hypothetical protein [Flavobacterium branchiarum]MDN3675001.1 hypothetical protein [Flavobacterium branchiarum]